VLIWSSRLPQLAAVIVFTLANTASYGQIAFTSSDKSLTITIPSGWKADESGITIRISGPDGSVFLLSRDKLKASGAEASTNASLRSGAEGIAKSLVSACRYAGVRPVSVQSGSGAVFRFRGKGASSDDDLAEVWVAMVGSHTAVLVPEKVPQPDHLYELSAVLKSISFAGTPKTPAASGRNGLGATPPRTAPASVSTPLPLQSTSREGSSSSPTITGEMRGYSGHLVANDISFKLNLVGEKSANAEWAASPEKTSRYSGDYSGSDGNYVVNLVKVSGVNPLNANKLTLTLRGMGGTETGTFTTDVSSARRPVSELNLTSIDSTPGHGTLKGGNRANVQRQPQNNNRGRQGRTGRMGGMNRMNRLRKLPKNSGIIRY
jgi:hypothetical protein